MSSFLIFARQHRIFLLVVLLSLFSLVGLFRYPYFPMHDDMQPIRVAEMANCLKDLQIPCRISSQMSYGYFYPPFNYYGPLPYYPLAVLHLLGVDLLFVIKIGFALSLLLGNIGFYFLARHFTTTTISLLATSLYAFMPYRLSDIFSRGAFGEAWAFALIPFVALFGFRLVQDSTRKSYLWFGVLIAALISTHNISTLIFLPFMLLLIFIYGLLEHRNVIWLIKRLVYAGLIAFGLSAFFLLPVVFEKSLVHIDSMISGYFDYRIHFLSFAQMFMTTLWGYGSSEIGPLDDLSFFFSPLTLVMLTIAAVIFLLKPSRSRALLSLSTLLIFLGATFMSHEKSSFIWSALPLLHYLQFPWRFLVVSNFFLLLTIVILFGQIKLAYPRLLIVISLFTVVILQASFAQVSRPIFHDSYSKMSGKSFDRQMTMSIFDYLPKTAPFPPGQVAPYLPQFSAPVSLLNFARTSNSIRFDYVSTQAVSVTLPMIAFADIKVLLDHKSVKFTLDESGVVVVDLPAGEHSFSITIGDSLIRFLGNVISLTTFLFLVLIYKRFVSSNTTPTYE